MQHSHPCPQHHTVTWARSGPVQNVTPRSSPLFFTSPALWKCSPLWLESTRNNETHPDFKYDDSETDKTSGETFAALMVSGGGGWMCVSVCGSVFVCDWVLMRTPCKWQVCQRCVDTRHDPRSQRHTAANNNLCVCPCLCVSVCVNIGLCSTNCIIVQLSRQVWSIDGNMFPSLF